MNGISNANRQQASFGAIKLNIADDILKEFATPAPGSANYNKINNLKIALEIATERLDNSFHNDTFTLTKVEHKGTSTRTDGLFKSDKFNLMLNDKAGKQYKVGLEVSNALQYLSADRAAGELTKKLQIIATEGLSFTEKFLAKCGIAI